MIDGYPDDVFEAAKAARDKFTGTAGHDTLDIADVIMAERERCAKVAETEATNGEAGEIWIARHIADAIRKGEA